MSALAGWCRIRLDTRARAFMSLSTKVIVALGAGLALGVAISNSGDATLRALPHYIEPVGTMWVNALRMTVIPLVVSSILIGITSLPDSRSAGRIGRRTMLTFLLILAAAASFATVVGSLALSRLAIDPTAAAALRKSAGGVPVQGVQQVSTAAQWIVELIPANAAKAAADGAILQLIVFTVLAGFAVSAIAESSREHLMRPVRAVYDAALVLVGWVLAATPIGVFALSVPLAEKLGVTAAGAVVFYVGAVSAMTVGFAVIFYLVAWLFGGQSVRVFARACLPVQAVAFSSRSSMASLPALLENANAVLCLPAPVRSFVLPLSVATFRPAGAIGISVGALFMARLYGVSLDAHHLVTITVMAIFASFSAPGIPNGSILIMVPVLLAAGIPVDAVGLLMGVDTIPDMVRTVTNVTGDMAVATVVARFSSEAEESAAPFTETAFNRG
jgi:proton glutamate symport protein